MPEDLERRICSGLDADRSIWAMEATAAAELLADLRAWRKPSQTTWPSPCGIPTCGRSCGSCSRRPQWGPVLTHVVNCGFSVDRVDLDRMAVLASTVPGRG
ncbi:hypothetical protein, partial [Bradyrhizobium sp. NBAIM08]|uniref:hypothetical protein n=1 Tax=Bradyrhizobium sp. NBAIM08 TaxID=2793815 RepID=UPI001CD51B9B